MTADAVCDFSMIFEANLIINPSAHHEICSGSNRIMRAVKASFSHQVVLLTVKMLHFHLVSTCFCVPVNLQCNNSNNAYNQLATSS